MRRRSPWIVLSAGALLLAVVGVISEFRNPPGGDPASLLYAAGRILDGARLYVDIVDLNPPFTFLFHIPFVQLARLAGIPVILAFRLGVLALIALSGCTLYSVLRRSQAGPGTRHALAAAFLLGSLGLVIGFFGEREHLQFVLVFPFLALASLRAAGEVPSRRLTIWTGLVAGIGFALKVTAGLVPVLVALVLWGAQRRRSDESLVSLVTLAVATGLGLLWAPGYFAEVRWLGGFYRGFSGAPVIDLLGRPPMAWPLVFAPVIMVIGWRVMRYRVGVAVWLVAGVGFVISVLVQGKGFPYHYYPATWSAAAVSLLVLASGAQHRGRLDALRRAIAGGVLLLMLSPASYVGWLRLTAADRVVDEFSRGSFEMLRDARPGTRVAVQSSRLADAFPLANLRQLDLVGRYPHLWFLYPYDSSAGARSRHIVPYADSILTPVERELRHGVAEDLMENRPDLVLVRDPGAERVVLRYLCDDSLYRRAATGYRLVREDSVMQLFQRDTIMHPEGACASW